MYIVQRPMFSSSSSVRSAFSPFQHHAKFISMYITLQLHYTNVISNATYTQSDFKWCINNCMSAIYSPFIGHQHSRLYIFLS